MCTYELKSCESGYVVGINPITAKCSFCSSMLHFLACSNSCSFSQIKDCVKEIQYLNVSEE